MVYKNFKKCFYWNDYFECLNKDWIWKNKKLINNNNFNQDNIFFNNLINKNINIKIDNILLYFPFFNKDLIKNVIIFFYNQIDLYKQK